MAWGSTRTWFSTVGIAFALMRLLEAGSMQEWERNTTERIAA